MQLKTKQYNNELKAFVTVNIIISDCGFAEFNPTKGLSQVNLLEALTFHFFHVVYLLIT